MNLTDLRRERFVAVNKEYQQYSNGAKYAEESKIRIETPLQNGVGQYVIDIKKQITGNKREVSLDRNDVFIPNFIGVFVALQSTDKPATELLMSYPALTPDTGMTQYEAGFLSKDIFALYNGRLVWNIDNGVLLGSYPTERFLKVPQTQGAFLLDTADTAIPEQILPEWDVLKACDLVIPKLTIAGTRDHQITINFDAAGLNFDCTEGYTPVLVFYMDGFLVKGGCEYLENSNPNAKAIGMW